ncbi:hypothetical protein MMYC01_207723 [Madurella mycetomatis]|uniref:Uncharacterized protein n=1 Tax=Madurella mycetomatis TaxID=100816 RepID=A0A175VZH2_9PEZI|nr:hypothetical protein MMYC01_207723 [Madurella mycetomatis]
MLPEHLMEENDIISEAAQPWTATRCHRLLRPLLAHIAALRKYKERRALVHNHASSTALGQAAKPRRTVPGKRSYPADDSDYDDKKPCRKYSRKASRRVSLTEHLSTPQRNPQRKRRQPDNRPPQDLVLPSPLLRRVRNHQPSSPSQAPGEPHREEPSQLNGRCQHSVSCGKSSRCAFEAELVGLRSTMDAERHSLYESVFKSFDSLLRVASPRKNHMAGSKSLLAMCLRKVPAYIAALEEWEKKDAEENGPKSTAQGASVSFEIYSELESLGAVNGWRHLCLVVRAHGVQIIQDAAAEGLLEDPVTGLLIRLCLEYMPPTEFMGIINTFVVRQYPKPQSADDDLFATPALRPLRILRSCDAAGSSLLPGILADLLADGLLPADWILTKSFIALWPSKVRLLTEMKPCQDTADFVVTTLENLCDLASPRRSRGVPQTRLRGMPQNTLVSAIAALGSVVLLSEEGSSHGAEDSSTARAASLRRRIDYVVKTCSLKLKRRKKGDRKLGTYLLALCSFLSLGSGSAATVIEASWNGVQDCRGNHKLMLQYDATTALMSAIAHYCSRGTGLAPNVYLSQFCDKLGRLRLPGGALSNMRVDGAFRLAEHTGDLRDLAFAETLQAKQATICRTPKKSGRAGIKKPPTFSGIRWDDGISEWVAATPATDLLPRRSKRVKATDYLADSDGDSDGASEGGDTDPSASPTPGTRTETETETEAEISEADPESLADAGDPESESESESKPQLDTDPLSQNVQQDTAAETRQGRDSSSSDRLPPPGGFLTLKPRRLSRPITITPAGDELAFDYNNSGDSKSSGREADKENWLCRQKPARFRPVAATSFKKRVARASLVYLQPLQGEKAVGAKVHSGGEASDDELSIL